MALKLFSRKKRRDKSTDRRGHSDEPAADKRESDSDYRPSPRKQLASDPLKQLFQQGRHNIILRDAKKWRTHADGEAVIDKTNDELDQHMALVPAGSVSISTTLSSVPGDVEDETDVEPFLLDIHCVTNARFQYFVDIGGYDALEFWPEEIWPHLIELKDLTGQSGPRYWRNGRHDVRLADHPVAGVSWYEAQAFALWIGQRLPTEAEWHMAASWHIKSTTDMLRRFPWGDAMDSTRCNLWMSRQGRTVSVSEFPAGEAPNHVRQLVGNVWEWTDSEYNITDDEERPIVGEMPMNVIRGAAFDTYFETQATNDFRTGQIALARTHNIGFRCAMDLSEAVWINGE